MFYDPNQENLKCPKNTCLTLIFIYIFLFLFNDNDFYYFLIFYRFFAIIIYIIIYININNAIKNKNFQNYSNGFCLSLFLSIFSTFIKIIYVIIIAATKDDDIILDSFVFIMTIIFIDWISTIVLKFYKEQFRNLCSNNNQSIIINNPLVQTNLANNNNLVQTNVINNQNMNAPSIQPYYPNVNPQPNVQSSNVYAQNYYPNINPQTNVQILNVPYDQNYYPDENEVNAQYNVQKSYVNLQAPTPNIQK